MVLKSKSLNSFKYRFLLGWAGAFKGNGINAIELAYQHGTGEKTHFFP